MTRKRAIRLPYLQNTPEWEEARRDGIGASDVPIITGSAPPSYGSRLELWALKTRRIESRPIDESTQELFDLGHALEPVIAERYTARTGRPLRQARHMLRHPDIPWATCSLDRVVQGERRIVEIKWDPRDRFSKADEDVPPHVIEQVQWQMFVTDYPVADVAVLQGSHVGIYEIPADPGFQADLLFLATRFWEDHVEAGVPPEADGREATEQALVRLYPSDDGEMLEPTAELDALMRQWQSAVPVFDRAEERLKSVKNAIRLALGEASGAESPRWRVTWKKAKDGTKTDWQAVAQMYRSLLVQPSDGGDGYADHYLDEMEQRHTTKTEGSRRLLPTWKKDEEEGSWT